MTIKTPNDEAKTCWDCNYLLPASSGDFTEFGICLRESVFEPYLEDLLDRQDYGKCKALVQARKFRADRAACPDIDLIDESATMGGPDEDDDSPRINYEFADPEDFGSIDITGNLAEMDSPDLPTRERTFLTLSFLASAGNDRAAEVIIAYFESLPAPTTVPESHHKLSLLSSIRMVEALRPRIQRVLIEELCRIDSNNTTRRWITEMLQFFDMAEDDRKALGEVLKRRRFSAKLQRRIEEIVEGSREQWWW